MRNPPRGTTIHPRRGPWAFLALLFLAAVAAAGEEDVYTQLLRRYEVVNSALQHAISVAESPAPVPAYPARLLSTGRNAEVTVGGEMRLSWIGSTSSYIEPAAGPDGPRRRDSKAGSLAINTSRLTVDARAGKRWRARLDINLNGHYGPHGVSQARNDTSPGAAEPTYSHSRPIDHINEFYVEMLKDGHSGLGLKAGVMKLPFGLSGRKDILPQSYMDSPDLTGSYLAHPVAWDNALRLPHASALLTPVTAVMLSHELRDIVRFEAALFQERDGEPHEYASGGVLRSRGESALPQSWQLGVSLLPLEGWELSMQFRNRHKRSRGIGYWADSPYRTDFAANLASGAVDPAWDAALGQWRDGADGPAFGSTQDEQALAVGLAFELPGTAWSFFLEYAKGWNQGFNRRIRSEGVNLGAAYRLTPRLTLNLQGEWLQVKDGSWMAAAPGGWRRDARTNTLRRVMLGAEYELLRGLTLEGGWQYEHWAARSAFGEKRTARAGMAYFGSRFVF